MNPSSLVFGHQREVAYSLSEHFDSTTVITTEVNQEKELLTVIHSPWRQNARLRCVLKFLRIFLSQIRKEKPSVVFSHMTDLHAFIISPFCWIFGIRHYLWYAHASKSPYLYFAYPLLTGVLTSTSGSCPIKSSKVTKIGQAVPNEFNLPKTSNAPNVPPLRWYHIGRIDKSKRIELIVSAVREVRNLGFELSIDLIGKPSSGTNTFYFDSLKSQYSQPEYRDWVKFVAPVPRRAVPKTISQYDGLIHAFQGSLDKALVEAVFGRRIVLTINSEFWTEFSKETTAPNFEPPSLEAQLKQIVTTTSEPIEADIERRHKLAINRHSFDGWITKTIEILKK